jgi:hypothetical protein
MITPSRKERETTLIWINVCSGGSRYTSLMETGEQLPGEPARHTGRYDELNVFGRQTGRTIEVEQGDRLPVLPRGFTWWHVPTTEC